MSDVPDLTSPEVRARLRIAILTDDYADRIGPRTALAALELVGELEAREEALKQIVIDWADHDSWRCYSTRYPGECCCGLDDAMKAVGMGDLLKAAPR